MEIAIVISSISFLFLIFLLFIDIYTLMEAFMEFAVLVLVAFSVAFIIISIVEIILYHRAIFMIFYLDSKTDEMIYNKTSPYCYSLSYDCYTMEVVLLENKAKTDSLYMFKKQDEPIYFNSLNASFLCRTVLRKKYKNFVNKIIKRLNKNISYIPKNEIIT